MDMNAEKMAEMKAQYAHMSEAEKEKLRKEKEKEIEDLLDFEKRYCKLFSDSDWPRAQSNQNCCKITLHFVFQKERR